MFHHHEHLVEPPGDALLWRYMDFTKFVSLLDRRALFFAAVDLLGDPYEGVLTRARAEQRRAEWGDAALPAASPTTKLADLLDWIDQRNRSWLFVNCWHRNDIESTAMWAQYLKTGDGVAVRTTFDRFKASLAAAEREVMGGLVQYMNYEEEMPQHDNPIHVACCKRKSYEHEREFRGIVFCSLDELKQYSASESGLYMSTDLNALIETVFVAPHAPKWLADLVESVLRLYGIHAPVVHSDLLKAPTYLHPEVPPAQLEKPTDAGYTPRRTCENDLTLQ